MILEDLTDSCPWLDENQRSEDPDFLNQVCGFGEDEEILQIEWKYIRKTFRGEEVEEDLHFMVYEDFRNLGYYPKLRGLNYGCDFLVYKTLKSHALYCVRVVFDESWREVVSLERLAADVGKSLIVCYWKNGMVNYVSVKTTNPNSLREWF